MMSRLRRRSLGAAPAVLLFGLLAIGVGCSSPTSITVTSDPPGRQVSLDGKPVGAAPQTLQVRSGSTIAVADAAATGAAAAAPASSGTLKTIRTAYVPITAYLPLYVAIDQGYFERFGVKVEAVEASSPNDILTGIAAGKIDFAAALAYTIIFPGAQQYPDSFKLFSSSEETRSAFTSSVITKKGSPLQRYQDLKGKRIGVYQGLVQVVFLKAMLHGMGINPKDVKIVEINPRLQIQGLVAEEYDALSSTEPTVNVATLQAVAQTLVENPRVRFIMQPFPSTAAVLSTKLLKEDPEAARGVTRGLDLAIEYINQHPEEAKRSLIKYTPIPENIRQKVLADLKLFKYTRLGEENRLNVQRFADYLFENKLLNKRIPDVNVLYGDYQLQER